MLLEESSNRNILLSTVLFQIDIRYNTPAYKIWLRLSNVRRDWFIRYSL
jgi:hypothetical protein